MNEYTDIMKRNLNVLETMIEGTDINGQQLHKVSDSLERVATATKGEPYGTVIKMLKFKLHTQGKKLHSTFEELFKPYIQS